MKKHKIAILTQPLEVNYGGLLQAYALRTFLLKKGHEVFVINRPLIEFSVFKKFLMFSKSLILRVFFINKGRVLFPWILDKEHLIIREKTSKFVDKYIKPTSKLNSSNDLKRLSKKKFTAFIVGSDQVWRPAFSPKISNYFLDFLGANKDIKRISYAASFGTDVSEYSNNTRIICKSLLQKFDAVSVREDSGVNLCDELFAVKAEHVLDPTLLLEKQDYEELVQCENESEYNDKLFTYILDESDVKNDIINMVSQILSLKPFAVRPNKKFSFKERKDIRNCVYPSVTSWLRAFMDANYVITDSFHGCVFSIIFNKPFIAIGNKRRGIARFVSLLKIFDLESRLIFDKDSLSIDFVKYLFDWDKINNTRKEWQIKSNFFIDSSL